MKRTLLLVVVTLVFVVSPAVVPACSCSPVLEIPQATAEVDAVFVGRVVELRLVKANDPTVDIEYENLLATIEVSESWKGVAETTVEVTTGWTCCMCGFGFAIGQSYLVYASAWHGDLTTSVCSRTTPVKEANEEILWIQEHYAPLFKNPAFEMKY